MTMTQPLHRPRSPQQDVGRLLSLASTSLALLALPQTDEPDAGLPEGDERSEQFVAKVGEYFETLDVRCVPLTHTTHPSIPTPFIGNTNGPPLLARAHPRRAYLPRCPHRATSRVRSPTSRRRAPLPAGTVRSWWQRWDRRWRDRKSTRLNSSHLVISYAVFCLKKKKKFFFYLPISNKKKIKKI